MLILWYLYVILVPSQVPCSVQHRIGPAQQSEASLCLCYLSAQPLVAAMLWQLEVGRGFCPLFPQFCWYCASLFLPKAQGGIRCCSQKGSWWQEERPIICSSCPTKEHEGREDEHPISLGHYQEKIPGNARSFSKTSLAGRRGISDRLESQSLMPTDISL